LRQQKGWGYDTNIDFLEAAHYRKLFPP